MSDTLNRLPTHIAGPAGWVYSPHPAVHGAADVPCTVASTARARVVAGNMAARLGCVQPAFSTGTVSSFMGIPNPAPAKQPAPQDVGPLTCFLVEDSPLIRQNLVATLEEMVGVQVIGWAEDEQGAVDWLQANPDARCDVLLVDIFLKAGSGLEVLRRARPLRPRSHMVVLSNYATADMRRRCLQLGADRVFDKSSELDELLDFFERLSHPSGLH